MTTVRALIERGRMVASKLRDSRKVYAQQIQSHISNISEIQQETDTWKQSQQKQTEAKAMQVADQAQQITVLVSIINEKNKALAENEKQLAVMQSKLERSEATLARAMDMYTPIIAVSYTRCLFTSIYCVSG